MHFDWLIIDGYNLLHQDPEWAALIPHDLVAARQRLVRHTEPYAFSLAEQVTIVFDGKDFGEDDALRAAKLEVFFSPGHLSADHVIEQLVCKAPKPQRILVITSDRAERDTVSGAGASTMTSQDFLEKCTRFSTRPPTKTRSGPAIQPRLGDLFPDL